MNIVKFKKLKNGMYEVELDDEKVILYDETILKFNLLTKKTLEKTELEKIKTFNEEIKCYKKSLKYLSLRLRSKNELEKYLKRFKFENKDIKKTIKRLTEEGYLNDKNFAIAYLNTQLALTNKGPLKIKEELLSHEISEDIIFEVLAKYDKNLEKEKIISIIDKSIKTNKSFPVYKLKEKIFLNLLNKGFSKDLVETIINSYDFLVDEEKEYKLLKKKAEKILKRLSKKYKSYELLKRLKTSLYNSGFQVELINRFIEEGDFNEKSFWTCSKRESWYLFIN